MFQYYWPEEVCCDKCGTSRTGSTFYISEEPLYSVCTVCDPIARKDAIRFANNLSEEDFANGWEWLQLAEHQCG